MTAIEKCPKCGGNNGFTYNLLLKTNHYGSWGANDDEECVAKRVYDPATVVCVDCRKRIPWDIAHGLSVPEAVK